MDEQFSITYSPQVFAVSVIPQVFEVTYFDPNSVGPQGVGVANVVVNDSNHLIVTLTNGDVIDAGNIASEYSNPMLPIGVWILSAIFDGVLSSHTNPSGMDVSVNTSKTTATFTGTPSTAGAATSLTKKTSGKWYGAFRFNCSPVPSSGVYTYVVGFASDSFDPTNPNTTYQNNILGFSVAGNGAGAYWGVLGHTSTGTLSSHPLVDNSIAAICADLDAHTFSIVTPDNVLHTGLETTYGMFSGNYSPLAFVLSYLNQTSTITLLTDNGGLTSIPSDYQNIAG